MKLTKTSLPILWALTFTLFISTIVTPMFAFASADSQELHIANATAELKGTAVVKAALTNNQLLVTVNDMEVTLNVSEETLIIDSKTGLPASLEGLKENDVIFVHYSAAMTRSLPPQSSAIAIVTQVEKDKGHAELFTIREIISREDDKVRALNKESDLIVTFVKEASLTPFKTKQIVTLDDIQVGTQLFIWYEIVAMSYPGQTGATKAVLVGQEEGLGVRAVYTPMAGADAVTATIQGKAIQLCGKNLIDHHGILLLSLRAVAEGLGFKVTWKAEDKSIILDDGTVKTTLYIGNDSYFKASSAAIGLTQNFSLGAPPMLIDDSTYVPAALFHLLYSDNNAVRIILK